MPVRFTPRNDYEIFRRGIEVFGPFPDNLDRFIRLTDFLFSVSEKGQQVYDMSVLSSDAVCPLRFTLNDSSGRGQLKDIVCSWMMEQKVYPADLIKGYAALFSTGVQFNIGMEYPSRSQYDCFPVVKMYYEDSQSVPDFFSSAWGKKKIRQLFPQLKDDSIAGSPDIICADFFPGGRYDLKAYYACRKIKPLYDAVRFPPHYAEPPCFYYEMRGLLSGRKKQYMAYPVETQLNPQPDMLGICRIFAEMKAVAALKTIKKWQRVASDSCSRLVPTLCSYSDKGSFSLYCRFAPK